MKQNIHNYNKPTPTIMLKNYQRFPVKKKIAVTYISVTTTRHPTLTFCQDNSFKLRYESGFINVKMSVVMAFP